MIDFWAQLISVTLGCQIVMTLMLYWVGWIGGEPELYVAPPPPTEVKPPQVQSSKKK